MFGKIPREAAQKQRIYQQNFNQNEIEIPQYLICPITQLMFLQPVTVFPSGYVYEKEIMERLFEESKKNRQPLSCPLTKIPLTHFVRAYNIESAVEAHLKANPNAYDQQYLRENPEEKTSQANKQFITPALLPEQYNIISQIRNDEAIARRLQQYEEAEYAREQHQQELARQ